LTEPNTPFDLSKVAPKLDVLADAISKVYVDSEYSEQKTDTSKTKSNTGHVASLKLQTNPNAEISAKGNSSSERAAEERHQSKGERKYTVNFGTLAQSFGEIATAIGARIWILLDEWSAIPEELQPYMADVIRRSLFPLSRLTVLIGAIEFRSVFQLSMGGSYTGIEVGADCSANINFDDFMVFESNPLRAKKFFEQMIFQHFDATDPSGLDEVKIKTVDDLINETFSQRRAFDELVKAAEGVPRDAINILALAASRRRIRIGRARWTWKFGPRQPF
jgi:hypothetical protein